MSGRSRAWCWLGPLLSGGLLTFVYPGWNLEWLVWLWLIPLLAVLWPVRSFELRVSGFKLGYLAGLAFFLPNLFWVRHSARVMLGGAVDATWVGWGPEMLGLAALVGLAGYCALYIGLWGWFVVRFARPNVITLTRDSWWPSSLHSLRCSFLAAAAWVACEWLRSTTVFTGFGWNGLGVAFHRNAVLMQAADLVGVMGLSFLPVFVTCTAWNAMTRLVHLFRGQGTCRSRLDFTVALVLILACGGYGMLKLSSKPPRTIAVRTALIQPNVSQLDAMRGTVAERTYERLANFTALYGRNGSKGESNVDLVVWPESSLPVHLYDQEAFHRSYVEEMMSVGKYSLLIGTEIEHDHQAHVSGVLFNGSYDKRQEYHKVHLVPFGEYLPLREVPPFSWLAGLFPGDFTPGAKTEPLHLEIPDVGLIPLICFEDTVGRVARKFVRNSPQMIVAMSNDGWFIDSIETEMHQANAIFRAVELRRPMVRCSNIGVTCFIDHLGRVTSRLSEPETGDTFIEGVLPGVVLVPADAEMSVYASYGDWFALLLLLIVIMMVIWNWKGTRSCKA